MLILSILIGSLKFILSTAPFYDKNIVFMIGSRNPFYLSNEKADQREDVYRPYEST